MHDTLATMITSCRLTNELVAASRSRSISSLMAETLRQRLDGFGLVAGRRKRLMEGKGHGSLNEKGLANPSFYAWRIAELAVIRSFSISESVIKRSQARTFGKMGLKTYKRPPVS